MSDVTALLQWLLTFAKWYIVASCAIGGFFVGWFLVELAADKLHDRRVRRDAQRANKPPPPPPRRLAHH